MKRRIKTLVAVTTLALTASSSLTAEACNRGGRRLGLPITPFKRHTQPVYSKPVYSTPVYSQPVYSQPVHSQAVHSQSSFAGSQTLPQQPVQTAPINHAGAPNGSMPVQPSGSLSGQVVNRGQVATSSGRSVNTAPAATAPTRQPVSAASRQQVNRQPAESTPAAAAAEQPNAKSENAEASALQMLASLTQAAPSTDVVDATSTPQIPEFAPADSSVELAHVGTWQVNLPGNQSVALELNGDGTFVWTATKKGQSNTFQGQYRLENDRLTLVRSNDLQQMTGSWTGSDKNFTFKLEGATTGGLNFTRT